MLVIGAAMALSACSSRPVPDSGTGVGFGDYSEYELQRARREAALRGDAGFTGATVAAPTSAAVVQGSSSGGVSTSDLASAGIGGGQPQPAVPAQPAQQQYVEASPTNAAPQVFNNPGISDEQDFDAVASRESIASDAARRQQQQAAYEVIAPTAVPERTGNTGPNIVAYALSAPNDKGQEWYSRSLLSGQNRFQRNCAKYASPDEAQRDFLARGGPERDRLGIDPDGDGFACGWDPTPFRQAARAAAN